MEPADDPTNDAAAPQSISTSADDSVALGEMYQNHFVPLARLAAAIVGDASTAQDVVQDVFVSLQRRWTRLEKWAEKRIVGYARRAVLNGAYSVVRRRGVADAHDAYSSEPAEASADQTALARISDQALRVRVAQLPRRQQQVILLRYLLDLSTAETAHTLGISVSAVTSSAARGITALQDTWEPGVDKQ